ncbi:MAG: hypothetical protein WAK13_00505, partial [Terriglobales bacterium]
LFSNMLLPNLILLIDVTFSTPTGVCTSVRLLFAFFSVDEQMGMFHQLKPCSSEIAQSPRNNPHYD